MAGTCKTCKYFKPSQGGPFLKMMTFGSGQCIRDPPRPWSVFNMARRPQVDKNQSCGQWEPKYDTKKYITEKGEIKRNNHKSNLIKILTTRYDQGEITKAEFEKIRKKILESK